MSVHPPRGLRPTVLVLLAGSAACLIAPLSGEASTLGRGWLVTVTYFACAVSCLLRARRPTPDRTAWLLFGLGITSYGVGDVVLVTYILPHHLEADPSVADPEWIAFYPCAYVATFLLVRRALGRFHPSALVDGLALGCALAAIARMSVVPEILHTVRGSHFDVVLTSLIYPLGDFTLIGVAAWAIGLFGRRPARSISVLLGAFCTLAVGDTIYVYRASVGNIGLNPVARIAFPIAMSTIALAAWVPTHRVPSRNPLDPRLLGLAAISLLAGLGVLASDHWRHLHTDVYILAAAAVGFAIARAISYRLALRSLWVSALAQRGFDDAPFGMALTDSEGQLIRVNAALARMLGRPTQTLVGQSVVDLTHPEDREQTLRMLAREDKPGGFRKRFLRPDGSAVETLVTPTVIRHPQSGEYLFSTHIQDISAELRAARVQSAISELSRRALAATELPALLDVAVETAGAALETTCVVAGWDGGTAVAIGAADPAMRAALAEVSAHLPDDSAARHELPARGPHAPYRAIAVSVVRRAGDPRYLVCALDRRPDAFGPDDLHFLAAVATILQSALERLDSEETVRHQALHDPLTGLANRTLCMSHLEHELARARRHGGLVAVALLDLDRFKLINDSLGHTVGDRLLRAVAPRLRDAVRDEDIVARLGGDEFIVVSTGLTDVERLLIVVERLRDSLAKPFLIGVHELSVRASIGIAVSRDGETDAESLIRDADLAMYQAKERGGGNHEVFDDALRTRLLARVGTERALRRALQRSELLLHWQPIVGLATGRLERFEALLRWERPGTGLLTAGAFLDVAEETGLMRSIGRFVLVSACSQVAEWNRRLPAGRAVPVSINLSAREVGPRLAEEVRAALEEAGIGPEQLGVELTEHLLMESTAAVSAVRELRGAGVTVALDDFGTGYSSLGYLQSFDLDAIKLDRAFVRTVDPEDNKAVSLLHAVVEMARALDLRVIAEGVETPFQLDAVRDAGCDAVQGYLLARPLPADRAQALLEAETPPWQALLSARTRS